jgi:hypothetical protein
MNQYANDTGAIEELDALLDDIEKRQQLEGAPPQHQGVDLRSGAFFIAWYVVALAVLVVFFRLIPA